MKMGKKFKQELEKTFTPLGYEVWIDEKYDWVTDIVLIDLGLLEAYNEKKNRSYNGLYVPEGVETWENWQTRFSVHKPYDYPRHLLTVFTEQTFEHYNKGPFLTGATERLEKSDKDTIDNRIEHWLTVQAEIEALGERYTVHQRQYTIKSYLKANGLGLEK
jgi:hypothetical protein